jgi:hypothetical protein
MVLARARRSQENDTQEPGKSAIGVVEEDVVGTLAVPPALDRCGQRPRELRRRFGNEKSIVGNL